MKIEFDLSTIFIGLFFLFFGIIGIWAVNPSLTEGITILDGLVLMVCGSSGLMGVFALLFLSWEEKQK